MRRRLVGIFLKVANLFICRLRAGKRLTKIKNWIEANGIKNRTDMIKKVMEDYKRSVNMRVTDDADGGDNVMNVKFKFQFNVDSIREAMMKLPL
jgi:glutamate synthase domain-containing protein 1